ncbi:MAG: Na+/H+ antiporter subunit E [Cyanobacteria bacterium P01_G01_bin.19]
MGKNLGIGINITKVINIVIKLLIWFLLTADLSLSNIVIGVAIATLLPNSRSSPAKTRDWLKVIWEIVKAIPQAYLEAFQIMLSPHKKEDFVRKKVKPERTSGLVFLDIFLITFTPKTIVTDYDKQGWYTIHRVKQDKNK